MFNIAVAKGLDSEETAAQLVEKATQSGDDKVAVLLIGGKHEPEPFVAAVREAYPNVEIVGGAVAGIIHPELVGYSGYEAGLMLIGEGEDGPMVLSQAGMDQGEAQTGEALGAQLRTTAPKGASVVLFYDSVASSEPLMLHPASPVLQGLYRGLDGHQLSIVGAGMVTNMFTPDSFMIHDDGVHRHSVTALVLPTEVKSTTGIAHGCRPIGSYMEITSINGAEVFELDGKPALDVLESILGSQIADPNSNISIIATLGQRLHGSPFAPYNENDYANRLILRVDPDKRSLTLFEPDFDVGAKVQIMIRDNALMISSLADCTNDTFSRADGKPVRCAFYIDCVGRVSVLSGSEREEADAFIEALPPGVPTLGFYSGVEIAPIGDRSRSLDWTGVLTLFHD
jgi:small ligand-binding sensory domain FIST